MNYQILTRNGDCLLSESAEGIREWMEEELVRKLDLFVILQENDDDEELEIYLHTDNYEDLSEEELAKLIELGISECNSLEAICQLLEITVIQ
ncbi:hypothetical protein HPT25_26515 [Bacillus sp. BRMEA1]|uniref:hypothetical protein n=1 Tax=Neobacillus endophyticus TaxID=2738405 RepID=UPI00156315F5|nr:hypothetical protein [Neobacillus endophyticus]NRD80886.1 hypothetical protein [Neobacillus endophyticus]